MKYLAMAKYPEVYNEMLLEEYEEEHGAHYNKEYAMKAVEEMGSVNADGTKEHGEHWNIEQVKAAIVPHRAIMDEEDTCWDAYVALNMWWHDLHNNYRKHSVTNADTWMIEDALTWAFADYDAPEGKIWHYMNSL